MEKSESCPVNHRVLVIEDESLMREAITSALMPHGYDVTGCETGEEGLGRALKGGFDLIIVDIVLPGIDGREVVARLRKSGDRTPAIFLTGLDREEDVIASLEGGGDDYITKPFSVRELVARIGAILRRTRFNAPVLLARNGLKLDQVSRMVNWEGESVRLTDAESRLLAVLMEARDSPVTREELLGRALDYDFDPGTKVLDVHLTTLRKKLRSLGIQPVKNIRNVGYTLDFTS